MSRKDGVALERYQGRTSQPAARPCWTRAALLDARGVPEQDQVVDEAGQRGRAGDGLGGLVLGFLEAEELLLIVKRDLNGPAAGIPGEDEGVVDGEVGTEERLVAAPAARITDDDDADRLVAQRTVPEGGAAEDERGDR